MSQPAPAPDDNYVLTLEEIGNLAARVQAAETLTNVVALMPSAFKPMCVRLLAGARPSQPVLARTLGLRTQCIGTLRMGLHEGLAGLVRSKFVRLQSNR